MIIQDFINKLRHTLTKLYKKGAIFPDGLEKTKTFQFRKSNFHLKTLKDHKENGPMKDIQIIPQERIDRY